MNHQGNTSNAYFKYKTGGIRTVTIVADVLKHSQKRDMFAKADVQNSDVCTTIHLNIRRGNHPNKNLQSITIAALERSFQKRLAAVRTSPGVGNRQYRYRIRGRNAILSTRVRNRREVTRQACITSDGKTRNLTPYNCMRLGCTTFSPKERERSETMNERT